MRGSTPSSCDVGGGGVHLVDAARGVGARARDEALEQLLADDSGDVGVHAVLGARELRRLEALDRRDRDALHEDAAQQLQAGGVARARSDHVDRHAERPEELGEALGAGAGGQRRGREARRRNRADQGDVGEAAGQRRRPALA